MVENTNMIAFQIITALVALYGAVLASYLCFRDRASVKVTVEPAMFRNNLGVIEHVLAIKVTNIGRRSLVLNGFPGLFMSDHNKIVSSESDRTDLKLNEGECFTEWIPYKYLKEFFINNPDLKAIFAEAITTTGQKSRHVFKENEWGELFTLINTYG